MYKVKNKEFRDYNDAFIFKNKKVRALIYDIKKLVNELYPMEEKQKKERLITTLVNLVVKDYKIIYF